MQSLDGPDHWRRKALFLDTLDRPAVAALAGHVGRHWEAALARWPRDGVALYGAAQDVLARAVCEWAGVSLPEAEAPARTRQLVALFDDAARGLLAHGRARWSRLRLQAWLAGQVERARRQGGAAAGDSPLQQVAAFRDAAGGPLDARLAATELLNVLRPVVAVSVYIVFGLHAVQAHPEVLRSRRDEPAGVGMDFLNEVRRYYPFFPAVAARVREDFEWNGYWFPKGRRAVLDLYGTNHDSRAWNDPDRFDPGRFRARVPTAFEFIPQGGADAARGHRCPGEDAALAIMKVSLDFLLGRTQCVTAGGDMALDYARLPALPRSELVVRAAVL